MNTTNCIKRLSKVITTSPDLTEVTKGWRQEDLDKKRWGRKGVIADYSNSHGLCYLVLHEDKTEAWYGPNELVELDFGEVFRIAQSELVTLKASIDSNKCTELPDEELLDKVYVLEKQIKALEVLSA